MLIVAEEILHSTHYGLPLTCHINELDTLWLNECDMGVSIGLYAIYKTFNKLNLHYNNNIRNVKSFHSLFAGMFFVCYNAKVIARCALFACELCISCFCRLNMVHFVNVGMHAIFDKLVFVFKLSVCLQQGVFALKWFQVFDVMNLACRTYM